MCPWEVSSVHPGEQQIQEQGALPQVFHPTPLQPCLLPPSDTTMTQTQAGKEDSMLVFGKSLFYLPLKRLEHCQGVLVQRKNAKVPALPFSVTFTLPWYIATSGSSQRQKKQYQSLELQMFPTNTPHISCHTSYLSPLSFLENSMLEIITDKNLKGCGPKLCFKFTFPSK